MEKFHISVLEESLTQWHRLFIGNMIELRFVGEHSPALDQVKFIHPATREVYLSVRGKTSGAYETTRTFQWTNAVQAVTILFLRQALYNLQSPSNGSFATPPALEGGKGSIVASLDYALDKQPAWLLDMFGVDANGKAYFKRLISRSNPGMRREGATRIALRGEEFGNNSIVIFWNSEAPLEFQKLLFLLRTLEKVTATISLNEVIEQSGGQPESETSLHETEIAPRVFQRASPQAAIFKTPFLQQSILGGDAYVRCYEQDSRGALVVSFVPYEELARHHRLPVRIHSSCSPSEALGAIDCDCKSQLDAAIAYLRANGGILIYLEQEGRGAGLFSKYQGMSISAKTGVDSYEAYKKMSLSPDLRSYSLVSTILKDLGIGSILLLTNNPTKTKEIGGLGIDVLEHRCLGQLSPQNYSYLYSKMTRGEHELKELFSPASPEFQLIETSSSRTTARTWIVGGDDTLWEDNIIYEDIIRLFIDHISRHVSFPRDEVRRKLDDVETTVIPTMGYGAPGFLVSLRKTFEQIQVESSVRIPEPSDLFDSVLPRLSSIGSEVSPQTIEVLRKIRKRGEGLILFVQGPFELQTKKIAQSKLGEYFDAIAMVPDKGIDTYKRLMEEVSIKTNRFAVVGNSLQTDVAPAIALNLEAVHFNNPNSWQLLNNAECPRNRYREISQFEDILNL